MKLRVLSVLYFLSVSLQAQFYAPELPWHDVAQRLFAIETARVLAGREQNAAKTTLTWSDETGGGDEIRMTIRWWVDGKESGRCNLQYPGGEVRRGAEFYRNIFRQVSAAFPSASKAAPTPAPPKTNQLPEAYWKGAALSAPTRLETCLAARRLTGKGMIPDDAEGQAALAGLLIHGALPRIASPTQLDALFLARGACWACLAEQSAGTPLPTSAWAPLLALAGRWPEAATLWEKDTAASQPVQRGWSALFNHQKNPKALIEQSMISDLGIMELPIHVYAGVISSNCADFTVQFLLGSRSRRTFPDSAIDYAPKLLEEAGMQAGGLIHTPEQHLRLLNTTLEKIGSAGLNEGLAAGNQETLTAAVSKLAALVSTEEDSLPKLLQAAAPILALGEGPLTKDPLRPVSDFSSQDVILYAWESTALQLAAVYNWYKNSLGDVEGSTEFAAITLKSCPGADAFFQPEKGKRLARLRDRSRYFLTDNRHTSFLDLKQSFSTPADDIRTPPFLKARWLETETARILSNVIASEKAIVGDLLGGTLERMLVEGGTPMAKSLSTPYMADMKKILARPAIKTLLDSFLERSITTIAQEQHAKAMQTGGLALAAGKMEELTWLYQDLKLARLALVSSMVVGDFDGYKRFIRESAALEIDSITWSQQFMNDAWLVGYFTGDDDFCQYVLETGSSYSTGDLYVRMLHAISKGDMEKAAELTKAWEARYPGHPYIRQLKDFLPYFPALKDPQHEDHGKALDFFHNASVSPDILWVILDQTTATPEERARFLERKVDPDPSLPLLTTALLGDRDAFDRQFREYTKQTPGNPGVIACLLRGVRFKLTPGVSSTSKMPADFELWEHKMTRLAKARQSRQGE